MVVSIQNDEVKIYQSLADNNTSSLSDTTKWKEVELGGSTAIDGNTITFNSNNEIQTIGVIDSSNNTIALKLWTGTRAEYDAITTKDSNTLYHIKDDTGELVTFANADLSNLSSTGEAHFANPDLSNLSAAGQARLDAKANTDLSNLSEIGNDKFVTKDTAQTISGVKTFSTGTLQAVNPVLLKENNADEGGQIYFERNDNSVLKSDPYIDLLINTIRFISINSNYNMNITLQVDLENNQVLVPTPVATANDNQAATTSWVNSKIQLVNEVPSNPETGVLYIIPES